MAKKKTSLTPEQRLQEALVPESEWPYQIPKNWCWTHIANLCTLINGKAFKPCDWSEEGVPIVRIQNLNNSDAPYNYYSGVIEDKFKLVGEELLFAWSGTPGTSFGAHIWKGTDAVLNQHIFRVDIDENELDKVFFMYAINQRLEQLISVAHGGAGLQHVTKGVFEGTPIPLPPFSEQQRIVDRIESLFAKLDEAKQKSQDVLDGFETRKAAILHKAFTGELTTKWRKEYNVKKENWVELPLKDCGEWSGGGTPSMQHPEYWDNGNIPWITSKDMKSDIIQDTLMHTTMLGIENSSARYINKPSLLFVTRSGILRRTFPVCMVKKPFTVNQDLKVLTPSEINLDFMFWACKAHEREILDTCMKSGTTVESINTAALKNHRIPVPSIPEQEEIVRILDDLLSKEQQAKEAAESVLEQIDLIKKSILARAFRGELGTNDPTEASSVELLKEILEKEA